MKHNTGQHKMRENFPLDGTFKSCGWKTQKIVTENIHRKTVAFSTNNMYKIPKCYAIKELIREIRGAMHVRRFGNKAREAILRWFGHVRRRDDEHVGRRMLEMKLPSRRKGGRPKMRFVDAGRVDMQTVGVNDTHEQDRTLEKENPLWQRSRKKKEF